MRGTYQARTHNIDPLMIPKSSNFGAKDYRFFNKIAILPSPDEIHTQAKAQHLAGVLPPLMCDHRLCYSKDSGLFVKRGTDMRISQGQCLHGIGQLLKDEFHVPEGCGWRQDSKIMLILTEYLQVPTLEQLWDMLETEDRVSVSYELWTICNNLCQLE